MIAVGRREGYCCRLDGDDDESESLFKSYTNVVPLRNPTLDNIVVKSLMSRACAVLHHAFLTLPYSRSGE